MLSVVGVEHWMDIGGLPSIFNQTPNTITCFIGLSTPRLSSAGERETSQTLV